MSNVNQEKRLVERNEEQWKDEKQEKQKIDKIYKEGKGKKK